MSVSIKVQVISFGNVILQIGSPTIQLETPSLPDASAKIQYQEPVETASSVYEFLYVQQQNTYFVPSFTSNF